MPFSRSGARITHVSLGTTEPAVHTWRPWIVAARPPTLWAAVAPVLVGSSLAEHDGVFSWSAFVAIMAAALLIQIGVNFANDYSDGVRGADTPDRIGPTRAVASGLISPQRMRRGVAVAFGAATLIGIYLTVLAGPVILGVGVISIVAALGYTGGPVPYGYRGLGELFVFVFFGLVATVGTRFVYDQTAPLDAWLGGVVMGCLASAILVANNIRDIETDAAVGKRTLAVMLGRTRTRAAYAGLLVSAFVVTALGAVTATAPPWTALALLAAPLVVPLVRIVGSVEEGPALIAALKGTARLQVIVAGLFSGGALI